MRLWIILQRNGVFGSNICMGGKLHLNEGAEFDRRRKAVLEQHKGIGAFAVCRRVCITADVDDMLRHALISIFVRLCKVFCLGGSALSAPPFFSAALLPQASFLSSLHSKAPCHSNSDKTKNKVLRPAAR